MHRPNPSLHHRHITVTGSLRHQELTLPVTLLVLVPQRLQRNDQVIRHNCRNRHSISRGQDKTGILLTQRNKRQRRVLKHLHNSTHHDLHNRALHTMPLTGRAGFHLHKSSPNTTVLKHGHHTWPRVPQVPPNSNNSNNSNGSRNNLLRTVAIHQAKLPPHKRVVIPTPLPPLPTLAVPLSKLR